MAYTTVIQVPSSLNMRLLKGLAKIEPRLAKISEYQCKIVEKGGKPFSRLFSKDFSSGRCEREKCMVCCNPNIRGNSMCNVSDVVYEAVCSQCDDEFRQDQSKPHLGRYIGETYRTLFERCEEHYGALRRFEQKSFMVKHWASSHFDQNTPPEFHFRVIKKHNDPLSRKIHVAVRINSSASMNSKSEWGWFKLNRFSIEQSDYEKMKEVVDIEAANKAESETIKSLKLRVSNGNNNLKSSYRKRKAAVSPEPGPEQQSAATEAMSDKNTSFSSLGAKPKKPRNTQGQSSVIPGTVLNTKSCSRKGKNPKKVPMVPNTPSVLAWLEGAKKQDQIVVTSTPTKSEAKGDAADVLNSTVNADVLNLTENAEDEPLIECDASAIAAVSFGTNASSEDCFFNEACDMTDAKNMLGSTENSTDDLLESVCEASVDEISRFYEKNKVSALGNVGTTEVEQFGQTVRFGLSSASV